MNIMHQTANKKTPSPMIRPRENTTAITNPPRKTLSRNEKLSRWAVRLWRYE
jgi:hypothetical protein